MVRLSSDIRRAAADHGLAVGFTDAAVLEPAASVLWPRRNAGLAATMQFTYRNPERSTDPQRALTGARSIVAAAAAYNPWGEPVPAGAARVARYSWVDHYQHLREGLGSIADVLDSAGFAARVYADANQIVDRNVAWRAGLGWWGKNANLLTDHAGSWVVLGAVVTDAELEPDQPMADGCGPCRRCIDGCPTDAIVGPAMVDARRCIAWLVQAAEPIPLEFRAAVGDRIYGCDVCQEVCPPTQQAPHTVAGAATPMVAATSQQWLDPVWLLAATDAELMASVGRWYLADRNPDVVRRTALVILGNTPTTPDGEAAIRRHLVSSAELLRRHAIWAARRHGLRFELDDSLRSPAIDEELAAEVAPWRPGEVGQPVSIAVADGAD